MESKMAKKFRAESDTSFRLACKWPVRVSHPDGQVYYNRHSEREKGVFDHRESFSLLFYSFVGNLTIQIRWIDHPYFLKLDLTLKHRSKDKVMMTSRTIPKTGSGGKTNRVNSQRTPIRPDNNHRIIPLPRMTINNRPR